MRGSFAVFAAQDDESTCPSCDGIPGVLFSRDHIAAELDFRRRFFARRLGRPYGDDELRDISNVTLGTPADILLCEPCGILIRSDAPGDESFADDRYADRILQSLHEAHTAVFRDSRADYHHLLPVRTRVAEVGSYAGGFLAAAREWGWSAIGVDIGRDVARFTRALGFDVRCRRFEECGFRSESLDAVFVWNCFEQVSAPRRLLDEAHRVMRDDGVLVLRIPDAVFYVRNQNQPTLLGYNSLLGWPHRHGFGGTSLRRLVEDHGFAFERALRRPVIRPLREAMEPWARAEERAALEGERLGWIEATFRRV